MPETANPWLPRPAQEEAGAAPPGVVTVAPTGPVRPQKGVPAPDLVDQLPLLRSERTPRLWVLGAHGGAGESTLAALDDAWLAAGHAWPVVSAGSAQAVMVARTNVRGLTAAKAAAKQWAASLVKNVDLLGLVLVADAPGRLPRPLRDLSRVVAGGYPRVWHIDWHEEWRLTDAPSLEPTGWPRDVKKLVSDLQTLISTPD